METMVQVFGALAVKMSGALAMKPLGALGARAVEMAVMIFLATGMASMVATQVSTRGRRTWELIFQPLWSKSRCRTSAAPCPTTSAAIAAK
jgi:hypothetical protein